RLEPEAVYDTGVSDAGIVQEPQQPELIFVLVDSHGYVVDTPVADEPIGRARGAEIAQELRAVSGPYSGYLSGRLVGVWTCEAGLESEKPVEELRGEGWVGGNGARMVEPDEAHLGRDGACWRRLPCRVLDVVRGHGLIVARRYLERDSVRVPEVQRDAPTPRERSTHSHALRAQPRDPSRQGIRVPDAK